MINIAIIGQRLRRLLYLMDSLDGSLLVMLETSHSHRNGTSTLRNTISSVESVMNRLKALRETVFESDTIPLA